MTGRLRYLTATGLTIASIAIAAAASEFDTALTDALSRTKTAPGSEYIAKYSKALGEYVTAAMDACGAKFPDMDSPAYIVLNIGADGRVTRKMAEPNSAFGQCIATHFPAEMKLPHPPEDGWPIVVGVQNRYHAQTGGGDGAPSSKASLAVFDQAVAPYLAKGRATYPKAKERFLKGQIGAGKFMVRIRLTQKPNKVEEAFLEVIAIKNGSITGTINRVDILTNYHKGERLTVPESEVRDWLIQRPDGSQEGNVIGKFLKQHKA